MGEWRKTTLGEVLTLQRGFDLPKRARTPGPYPVVSSSGVTGETICLSHHRKARLWLAELWPPDQGRRRH